MKTVKVPEGTYRQSVAVCLFPNDPERHFNV
jgi:hypothetical protein